MVYNRSLMVIQHVFDGYTTGLRWLYNRSPIVMRWLYNMSSVIIPMDIDGSTMVVPIVNWSSMVNR